MRRRITTAVRAAAALALMVAMSATGASGAGALTDKDIPSSMHGAVETQAVTVGNGALSLLVDPGTAYAYSTLDRDDYGGGSVNYAMTARGANLNLGTIAYAVLWPPPDCTTNNVSCATSGQVIYEIKDGNGNTVYKGGPPNTGLHEAKGFPLYAEALYPPPPSSDGTSQERVYKCVLTKDGPGSPPTGGSADDICKQSDSIPMTAWAETIADEYRSTGYSRAEGFDVPGVMGVHGSESHSEVKAIGGGMVRSFGSSNVTGIDIMGGLIHIDSVYSAATVVSGIDGVDPKRSSSYCTFSGLTVNGQSFTNDLSDLANQQLQQQLNAVAAQTGYQVQLIAPSDTQIQQVYGGKFVSGCQGLQIKFTDLHTSAPVPKPVPPLCSPVDPGAINSGFDAVPACVPALGNREELSFGRVLVQQAVNDLGGLLGGGGDSTVLDAGGGDFASAGSTVNQTAAGGAASGGSAITDIGGGTGSGSGSVYTGGGRTGGRSGSRAGGRTTPYYADSGGGSSFHPREIGALTAASGLGVLLGAMVLIGVVNALAGGRPFRLPGF
jgi:hypothetical protein